MSASNWIFLVLCIAFIAFFLLKRASFARGEDVEAALKDHALVIDVRTEGEYASGHLAGTTNIPLARLAGEIEKLAPDRQAPIALHCLSGGRSASAMAMLKRLGYTRVYNLGSYSRAEKLLKEYCPR
jgi:phage shock protein E